MTIRTLNLKMDFLRAETSGGNVARVVRQALLYAAGAAALATFIATLPR